MKAILIVDIPKNCIQCEITCQENYIRGGSESYKERPSWCPLKPMPEPIKQHAIEGDDVTEAYIDAWNACLEEIEK